MVAPQDSFDRFLRETLPWIDDRLSRSNRPLQQRPIEAAQFVVDQCVVEIHGETKDDYLSKPWFATIFRAVHAWYERRYGEAMTRHSRASASGFILYLAVPLPVRVPLVLSEPAGDGSTAWIRFPRDVLPHESPLAWLEPSPPPQHMPKKRLQTLTNTVVEIAALLRAINNDINSADLEQKTLQGMARTVMRHFSKGAQDATADSREGSSLAIWEFQMACEKTIKVYLGQHGISYPETHNLRALSKLTGVRPELMEASRAMAALPTDRRVNAWRYGEIPPPEPRALFRVYRAALAFCSVYAKELRRTYVLNNFAVQIQRPPWFTDK